MKGIVKFMDAKSVSMSINMSYSRCYIESIKDMYMCFTKIINKLNSLWKTYTNKEMVRKVLRSLPRSKRGPNVMTIEEAQDLEKFRLYDLKGKLLNHEIHLHEENEEQAPQQGITLKSNAIEMQPKEAENDKDESLT